MSRLAAVLAALLLAVQVAVGPLPAPVPVFLGFAAVIAVQLYLIYVAAGLRITWRAGSWQARN